MEEQLVPITLDNRQHHIAVSTGWAKLSDTTLHFCL